MKDAEFRTAEPLDGAIHGLICKAFETFVRAVHGPAAWAAIRRDAELPADGFEAMDRYAATMVLEAFGVAGRVLDRRIPDLLESMGTWLITDPALDGVRRLFRFSGATFEDALFALDELDARARLAVPDLVLPTFRLTERGQGHHGIEARWAWPGAGAVTTGLLRALADDYGTLALIEHRGWTRDAGDGDGSAAWIDTLDVRLVDARHQAPRAFALGGVR